MKIALHPYLTFAGNCEEAFLFYKSVFGGEFSAFSRFADMPASEAKPSAAVAQQVLHVSLPVGDSMLMGSDAGDWDGSVTAGNNVHISINLDSGAEADRIFEQLSKGGSVTMPMAKAFWGAYFGMLTDKFGIHWMVNAEE